MKKLLGLVALMLVANQNVSAGAWCTCEHFGSQYDGICWANSYPQALTGNETFDWTPYGAAWIPYPSSDPHNDFQTYDTMPGAGGGLMMTIHYPNGTSNTSQCGLGTPGGN
jgi:hypothetical protein